MANPKDEKNVFFDINKLPPEKGLLLFGLSMNKLDRGGGGGGEQTAEDCVDYVKIFHTSKVSKPLVGLNLIYGDFLYLYSDKPAPELKKSFMHQVIQHKNSFQKIIEKNSLDFQIQHGFNYMVWNQLYVGTRDFDVKFRELKDIYEKDEKFQKYIKDDCDIYGREMGENQVNFYLEEILMFYLLTHNKVKLPNEYIENQQKWILYCYPGRPLKSTVYLYQLNPFKLECPENPYTRAHYDLSEKKLIEFDRVDLETYKVK
jgi:hypothetical protein